MIPEGWTLGQVSDVCRLQNGYGFTPPVWDTKGLPIIRIQNLNGSQNFNYYSGEPNPNWIVEPGQMLFAWAGTKGASFGPTIWKGETGVLNQHIFKVFEANGVDHDWLFALLRQVTDRIEMKAHGFKATLVHVKKSDIENQSIHIPPLPEQRKIAEILSVWDAAIEKTEALLATARTQKRALMQQLLTGRRRFPEFEGQPWKKVRLGDILEITYGKSPKAILAEDGDFPVLGTGGVTGWTNTVMAEGPAIVVGRKGTIDSPQWVDGAFWCIDTTYFCKAKKGVDLAWVFAWLGSIDLRTYNEASGVPSLSRETLRAIRLSLPCLEEQASVAKVFDNCNTELASLSTQITKLRAEKKALMQQLLTGKRRVTVEDHHGV